MRASIVGLVFLIMFNIVVLFFNIGNINVLAVEDIFFMMFLIVIGIIEREELEESDIKLVSEV